MKATVNREGLLTAFQVASGVVPTRSTKPILQSVKLELADDGKATLMATDLELGIRYAVTGVETETAGAVMLPTSEFVAILRELPDETLKLETDGNNTQIVGASSKFELPGEDPAQFPEVPDFATDEGSTIKSGMFAQMVRRTAFAAADQNTRYALNSVLIEIGEGEDADATLIATDGKRLAMMPGKVAAQGDKPEGHLLLPPKALLTLAKVLHDPAEDLRFILRSNEALFRTGKVTVYTRLNEGRFPRYQDVFPAEPKVTVPLVVQQFAQVIRQAKIVTSPESKGVDFAFEDGLLTLTSRGPEVGESEIKMPIGYDGERIEVTFDPQLLIDALKVLEPEQEVNLEIVDGKKAVVMRTADKYAYVIMPLTRER